MIAEVVIITSTLGGITVTEPQWVPSTTPDHVVIEEDFNGRTEISKPTILAVRMNQGGNIQERCDHMGGALWGRLCWSVDY